MMTKKAVMVMVTEEALMVTRGLHSSTSQLNVSAFRDLGGALRGC